MENKIVRIIGPAATVDALVEQAKSNPEIETQEISLDEIEREMRMIILLHTRQRELEAKGATEEFEAGIHKKLRETGIK